MTPEDFKAWRERMGFNRVQAAEALGVSRNMPQRYEDGHAEIPLYIALACAALVRGIAPWPK
ncbi:helix-turn-helix domain-containing protein [Brucella sp. IR073]|uniref:helix-turn-helix domain-containing protein n=1 Tax=unclassified Brucella TaxID=2632610 RepID=UPI003B9879E9